MSEIKWETEELPDVGKTVIVCDNWGMSVYRLLERKDVEEDAPDEERYYFANEFNEELNIDEVNGWFYPPEIIIEKERHVWKEY